MVFGLLNAPNFLFFFILANNAEGHMMMNITMRPKLVSQTSNCTIA